MKVNLPLIEVPDTTYGSEEAAMVAYREEGTQRALAMDNRGPFRFTADGKLDPAIVESFSRYGFYVFTNFLSAEERGDLERDLADLLDRQPVEKDGEVDKYGNPAFNVGQVSRSISWVKPLSDPLGGTEYSYGRHPSKMFEPQAADGAVSYTHLTLPTTGCV